MAGKKSKAGRDQKPGRAGRAGKESLRPKSLREIQQQAQQKIRYEKSPPHPTSEPETASLVHNFRVHQIELEMQNEELRRAQAELEESRSKYSDLFDFAPVGYFVLNAKGAIVEANLTGAALLGMERRSLLNRPFTLCVSREDKDSFYRLRKAVGTALRPQRDELKLLGRDRREFFAELLAEPVRDAEGKVTQCRIAVIDITQRKNAERELTESRERLQLVIESSNTGTWDWDVQSKSIEWNDRLYEMLGLPTKTRGITAKTLFHHVHPQDLPRVQKNLAGLLKSGTDYEDTFRIVRGDGEIRWLSSRGRLFRDDNRKPLRMMGVNYDVTEDKRAQEALRQSEQKFHGLFTSMGEAVVLFELIRDDAGKVVDCRVLDANPAVEKMTGVSPAEALGRTMRELFPSTDDFWYDTYGKVETAGKPVSFERRFAPLNRFYHTCVYRPAPGRVAVVFMDITKHKKAEQALRETKEELERNVVQLETTLDSLTEGLVIADLDGNLFYWNPAAVTMHGFSDMEECVRKLPEFTEIFELSTEADGILAVERWPLSRILRGETLRNCEVHIRRRGNNWHRIFNYGGMLARNKESEALLAVISITDITARKQAAERIETLARFPSEDPAPVLRVASDGTVLYSNGAGLAVLEQWNRKVGQQAPDDWCKRVAHALDSGQNIVRELKCRQRLFSLVAAPVSEGRYINLYGRDITKERRASRALRRAHNELEKKVQQRTAELAQAVDILEEEIAQRKRAEETVRERSRVLNAFFSHTITPLAILDAEFNFIRVNKAYSDADERDISDFAGHNHFEYYPHEENQQIFEDVVRTKTPYEAVAKPFSFPDHPEWGVTYWDWTLVPVLDEAGEVELLIFSLEDVTARKRSDLALEQSEARHRALVELSPDPIVVAAGDRIAFANPACVELAGARSDDELVGRPIWDFIHPESHRAVEAMLRVVQRGGKRIALTELKTLRPDGKTVEVEVSASPIRYAGEAAVQAVLRDITERKQAESRTRVTNTLLELFTKKASRQEYLDSVVETIRDWSGCRCVGVRLMDDDDYIPYHSSLGFSEEFLSVENMLCLSEDVCACIRVTMQTPDPQDGRAMTPRGSFRCENTFQFVESLAEPERGRYRSTCLKHGFASLAIVPIRYREKIFGVLHLADEHENKVPIETVKFLENMAVLIGEAIHRFNIEGSLRLSRARLLEAQRIAHLGNWDMDYMTNKLWWSEEVYRIFGVKSKHFDATYEAFLSFVHPEDRGAIEIAVNEALHNHKPYSIDHRIIRPDGTQRIVHERGKVFYDAEKRPVRMMGTVQDITEIKQTEQRLLVNQEALRSLTSELELAEERERRRLARDLHDSIGQILAFSKWELFRLRESAPSAIADGLKKIESQLDAAVKQARTLSFELSPSVLYDLGLELALEDLIERFNRERKIACRFDCDGRRRPLPDPVKVFLYRSIRELLINVAKHAKATAVTVSLQSSDSELRVAVEDNGEGFDVSALDDPPGRSRGFGVLNIRERLRHIGGRFEIESRYRSGTKVTLVAPTDIEQHIRQDNL